MSEFILVFQYISFCFYLVYLEDVKSLCERPAQLSWISVILLVPVRLGGQALNPSYIACVKVMKIAIVHIFNQH